MPGDDPVRPASSAGPWSAPVPSSRPSGRTSGQTSEMPAVSPTLIEPASTPAYKTIPIGPLPRATLASYPMPPSSPQHPPTQQHSSATTTPPQQVMFPQPGQVLASPRAVYHVGRTLGQGAYGAVYEATGPFDQRYALKLLVPANRPYAEVHAEWVREAERLLRLRHPGVVYMHDAFESEFLFYMALEWCSSSLKDWLVGPLEPETAIEVTRQILAAVQYLHESDIVHGDLHPGNVLVLGTPGATAADGGVAFRVKLADFGISQELHGRGFARPNVVHHAIMAPEVVAAGYTSRQSDIYQIGLLLYWMVTGTAALDYALPYADLVKQVAEGVPRTRAEGLKSPIGAILAKMLRRREAYRYASAREVWDDLKRFWTPRPT